MQDDTTKLLKSVKYLVAAFGALTALGVATLMYISWDKDEDITGIVVPALLLAIISLFVAIVAAGFQRSHAQTIEDRQ
jgi:cytochrome c oxidase subunit IV